MTLIITIQVLLIVVAVLGVSLALTSVVRGDGRVGPGRAPQPPRSHPADIFEQSMRRML